MAESLSQLQTEEEGKPLSGTEPRKLPVRQPSAFYRPELDALRFFAFLSVFIFHTLNQPVSYFTERHLSIAISRIVNAVTGAGSRGVDLFFVLSAYLITELLIREKQERGSLDVKSFYLRRILRIWPLYYVFLFLAAWVPFLNPWQRFTSRYLVGFMVLCGNWATILFGPTGSVAEPLWSVSVEEQFYLTWAPIVAKLSSRRISIAAVLMIALANIARGIELVWHATGWQIWANTFTHLDAMAGGILVAIALRNKIPRIALWARLGLICGSVVLIVASSYVIGDAGTSVVGVLLGYPAIAFACTAIVVAFLGLSLKSNVLRYLGKISYGLYVYHLTCVMVSARLLPMHWGAAGIGLRAFLALVLTIALAAISYQFFEAPFLKLKRHFTYVDSRPV